MGIEKKSFCDNNIRPLIVAIIILGVITIMWAFVTRKELFTNMIRREQDRDAALAAKRAKQYQMANPVPTPPQLVAHTVPVNPGNMMLNAITRATPGGGVQLVKNMSPIGFQDIFKNAIMAVEPAVVDIHATCFNKTLVAKRAGGNQNTPRFTMPFTGNVDRIIGRRPYENIGAGFFVDQRGYLLTNYHVIENASAIVVTVAGTPQRDFQAKVIMTDPLLDVALLKVMTTDVFPITAIGSSSQTVVGDWVIAIGSPFGLDMTVTAGIVSGLRKSITIDGNVYKDLIQTDTPINKGNSGGPLVNLNGEVVGITTAIYAPTGVFNGTGFAIPIDPIKEFLRSALGTPATGMAQVAFMNNPAQSNGITGIGLEVIPVNTVIARELRIPFVGGAMVNRVFDNTPAATAGLLRGDVITSLGGVSVMNTAQIPNVMQSLTGKTRIEVTYYRNGREADCLIFLR